ncbi:MAG: hypothetical protein ACOYOU_19465, partial [Kiritimatiellia bacterium]
MYDIRENEHQELFYLGIDPLHPVAVHIPSPLGTLGYFVYVRVPQAAAARVADVGFRLAVGGLREEDVTVAAGSGAPAPVSFAAKDPAYAWRCLGKADVSRGNGFLTLLGWPAGVPADVLITTWPRFAHSGLADDWLAGQADPQWAPTGVPLGSIGGGRVDICRDGRFRNFIMNNNQDAPVEDPDGLSGAYLALTDGGVTRDLASRPIVVGHAAVPTLQFDARFPQATLTAPQVAP